ncbi:hypothetical protein COOONC_26496 [Cooperia oncophora]
MARDNGSMHRKEYLDEADDIISSVQNITMKYGERRLIYRQMCEPHCFGDEIFKQFKRAFDISYGGALEFGIDSVFFDLSYPFGHIMTDRVPFDRCLYGVRLKDSNASQQVSIGESC